MSHAGWQTCVAQKSSSCSQLAERRCSAPAATRALLHCLAPRRVVRQWTPETWRSESRCAAGADEIVATTKVWCASVDVLHRCMYHKPCLRTCGTSLRMNMPSCGIKGVVTRSVIARMTQLTVSLSQWLGFAPHCPLLVGQICTHVSMCACESTWKIAAQLGYTFVCTAQWCSRPCVK